MTEPDHPWGVIKNIWEATRDDLDSFEKMTLRLFACAADAGATYRGISLDWNDDETYIEFLKHQKRIFRYVLEKTQDD